MSNNGVRLQNLRDFTVQIRHPKTDRIVGTGFVVSSNGHIVTCGHVVIAAGVNPRQDQQIPGDWEKVWKNFFAQTDTLAEEKQAEVTVYFSQLRGGETKTRRARVAAYFPDHDDDVVLLQLVDGISPLGPEQIAVLGRAEDSCEDENRFRSYGYRRLDHYVAGFAHGFIMGVVESPPQRTLLADPVQLESNQINRGMSGGAVLDKERNLVVGVISETWFPDRTGKDSDTAWAVNARVLSLEPLNLPLRDEPLPKRPTRQPSETEQAAARQAPQFSFPLEPQFHNAPPSLRGDWAGRTELLQAITADWTDPERRVSGLIGFGGEGKSSLARRWLGDVLNQRLEDGPCLAPDGVFWWGFYENRSVDAFFEAALTYLGGGDLAARVTSAAVRAGVIAELLKERRYLLVLDGLEVMQHQDGDSYGLLLSNDLRDFFSYLAGTEHESFCLVTSRAPLLDLLDYPAYTHHDVERLSDADARALLRNLGVQGSDEALDHLSHTWDNHALTLSLLGSDIVARYRGDLAQATDLPTPDFNESHYERVARVLRRYDEHLTEAERAFLTIFSAFRLPVHESAFEAVFRTQPDSASPSPLPPGSPAPLLSSLATLDDSTFSTLLTRLTSYRLLRYNPHEKHYTTHPLIRNHYEAQLAQADPAEFQEIHRRIKDYYLAQAGDETPEFPTLGHLAPFIEAVHHACRAGVYDEAFDPIYWNRITQASRKVIIYELGAYETNLLIMLEFFPNGDTTQEPQVSQPAAKRWILNETGFCLMSLGRLAETVPFYERANVIQLGQKDWHNASLTYQNLADLHASLGDLAASAEAAREALTLARRAENKQDERNSLGYQAWADHLRGDMETAAEAFDQAEVLQREIDSSIHYRYSLGGIQHAEHLRRTGDLTYARLVTAANLEICQQQRWQDDWSRSHRVLGDLDAAENQHDSARVHYDEALRLARGISAQDVLIEALLARGRWAARQPVDLTGFENLSGLAFNDLDEALAYAVEGGYRIYEADIRVALAWAHRAAGQLDSARAEASRALQMSQEMGYYWGQVDAEEVLEAI